MQSSGNWNIIAQNAEIIPHTGHSGEVIRDSVPTHFKLNAISGCDRSVACRQQQRSRWSIYTDYGTSRFSTLASLIKMSEYRICTYSPQKHWLIFCTKAEARMETRIWFKHLIQWRFQVTQGRSSDGQRCPLIHCVLINYFVMTFK